MRIIQNCYILVYQKLMPKSIQKTDNSLKSLKATNERIIRIPPLDENPSLHTKIVTPVSADAGFHSQTSDAPHPYIINVPMISFYKIKKSAYTTFKIISIKSEIETAAKLKVFLATHKSNLYKLSDYNSLAICPVCGSVLKIIEYPICFGDDDKYQCVSCRNEFLSGGTRILGYKYDRLEDLSANPEALLYESFQRECQKKVRSGDLIFMFEKEAVIVKKISVWYQIRYIIKMS